VIITNKHVVNDKNNETVEFFLHVKDSVDSIKIQLNIDRHFHPTQDLCFCFVNPLVEEIKKQTNKDVFYCPIIEEYLCSDNKLQQELKAIEDVIMVGYPRGLWDEKNNFPLFRKGITASHPAIDFNRDNIGVVDMACFP